MNKLKKRITKLEAEAPEIDLYDYSLLTDQELDFLLFCFKKAGFEWNKDGDITLLSEAELKRFEEIHERAKKQD